MRSRKTMYMGGIRVCNLCAFVLFIMSFVMSTSFADLGPENVLILVNSDSATSRYIARMYREYYPAIEDIQVLELNGLPDSSGPNSTTAHEILTRQQYNTCIAEPVRRHLTENNLVQQIMVIITTAGMPYRIEDTQYTDVVYPAGSNYNRVLQNCSSIDAASVESELTCLWYADEFGLSNRMVNPYQGYRNSSITLFERSLPGTKTMQWSSAISTIGAPPKMEGFLNIYAYPLPYGTVDRVFDAGDCYLTCRLDGPKAQGQSAVFAVRQMLERSKRASSSDYGVNPLNAVVVIDDCADQFLDSNRIYNLDNSMNYYTYEPQIQQPPDATTVLSMDDYTSAYEILSSETQIVSGINIGWMDIAGHMKVLLDRRSEQRSCQECLEPQEVAVFYCCYGKNGDEGSGDQYLLQPAGDCDYLLRCSNGAVFTSFESFNALTMFSDETTVPVAQGKIIDFITIGGSGAIGHAFEPLSSAAIDNVYLTYNLLADSNGDQVADMTFIEAAFTAIPFLSWAEVVIGDPLMRISYNSQGNDSAAWSRVDGDINHDGYIDVFDYRVIRKANMLQSPYNQEPYADENYDDRCDINYDGFIDVFDIRGFRSILYSK